MSGVFKTFEQKETSNLLTYSVQRELEASGKTDNLKKIVGLLLTKKGTDKSMGGNVSEDAASSDSTEITTVTVAPTIESVF